MSWPDEEPPAVAEHTMAAHQVAAMADLFITGAATRSQLAATVHAYRLSREHLLQALADITSQHPSASSPPIA